MGIVELLGLAGSVSLIAGWRLYLTVFITGLAMRLGWISLPEHLQLLDALANPWVLAISALGALAEFFADKILWLDSIWDTIHTVIRPLGGALLALAVVDAGDPAWQVAIFLLGGGAALVSHGAKAGARALVNTSPEPVSNAVVSTGEDIATGGLLFLAFAHPVAAMIIASLLLILCLVLVYKGYGLWRKIVSSGS
ncbi:MAG: DUF4126 domain-containing protein [Parasphingorhabdus sp.]|mgnify:CR=1 FL=1|jgi:hypothetical protein|nr:DUF4126 domain-containing protein [Parasphingorhabdus sp.]